MRPQLAGVLESAPQVGSDHVGACEHGELDRICADVTAGTENEHPLSGLHVREVDDHLEGGHGHHRHAGAVHVIERWRLRRDHRGARNGEVSVCAGELFVGHAEHGLADLEARDLQAELDDDPREIGAERQR